MSQPSVPPKRVPKDRHHVVLQARRRHLEEAAVPPRHQPLSFINNSNMASVSMISIGDIHNMTASHHQLSCSINLVNWSRWLLGYPVHYFKYGHFKQGKILINFIVQVSQSKLYWESY